jgi:adenylosuccinate synthase
VCTAYEVEGRIVRDLPVIEGASIEQRSAQTALLAACRPMYTVLSGWRSASDPEAAEFLRFLESEEALGIPISIASWGPRAGDKIELA